LTSRHAADADVQSPQVPGQYCCITVVQDASRQYRTFAVQFIGDTGSSPQLYAAVSQQSPHVFAHSKAKSSKFGSVHFGSRGSVAVGAAEKIARHAEESRTSAQFVAFGLKVVGFALQEAGVIAFGNPADKHITRIAINALEDRLIIFLLPKN
jgi:hypothetical protein